MLFRSVVGEADMSGVFRIRGDGFAELPYAGKVSLQGLNLDQASAAIRDALGTVLVRPQVVVTVETYGARRVDVDGIVAKPSTYWLDQGRTTVSQMIVRAGGLSDPTAPRAIVFRDVGGMPTPIPIDLDRINVGDVTADIELRAGDRLYVPPVESVYVEGQVSKPGAIAYRDGMTVTQAIAQGGGALGTARRAGVYIMRGGEKIPVNLKRIQAGEDADIVLRPSDHVYIPESAF